MTSLVDSRPFGYSAITYLLVEWQAYSDCAKHGKTSLVKGLGLRIQAVPDVRQIFVLRDLETLPSEEVAQIPNLLEDLR